MSKRRLRAYLELFCVVVIWGIAAVVIKATLNDVHPPLFLAYRFLLSTLLAVPAASALFKLLKKPLHTQLEIWLYALLSVPVALGFLFWGLNQTTVVNLSVLTATSPLLLSLAGVYYFKEHMTKRARFGATLALIGALLTIVEPVVQNYNGIGSFAGNMLLLVYLVADICSILLLKKLTRQGIGTEVLTHLSFILGFVVFAPLLLLTVSPAEIVNQVSGMSLFAHLGVIFMAVVSGTFAYNLRAKAQKYLTINEASLFGYLSPIISTILALIFLSEHITFLYGVGAAVIAIGVFLAEFKKSRPH